MRKKNKVLPTSSQGVTSLELNLRNHPRGNSGLASRTEHLYQEIITESDESELPTPPQCVTSLHLNLRDYPGDSTNSESDVEEVVTCCFPTKKKKNVANGQTSNTSGSSKKKNRKLFAFWGVAAAGALSVGAAVPAVVLASKSSRAAEIQSLQTTVHSLQDTVQEQASVIDKLWLGLRNVKLGKAEVVKDLKYLKEEYEHYVEIVDKLSNLQQELSSQHTDIIGDILSKLLSSTVTEVAKLQSELQISGATLEVSQGMVATLMETLEVLIAKIQSLMNTLQVYGKAVEVLSDSVHFVGHYYDILLEVQRIEMQNHVVLLWKEVQGVIESLLLQLQLSEIQRQTGNLIIYNLSHNLAVVKKAVADFREGLSSSFASTFPEHDAALPEFTKFSSISEYLTALNRSIQSELSEAVMEKLSGFYDERVHAFGKVVDLIVQTITSGETGDGLMSGVLQHIGGSLNVKQITQGSPEYSEVMQFIAKVLMKMNESTLHEEVYAVKEIIKGALQKSETLRSLHTQEEFTEGLARELISIYGKIQGTSSSSSEILASAASVTECVPATSSSTASAANVVVPSTSLTAAHVLSVAASYFMSAIQFIAIL